MTRDEWFELNIGDVIESNISAPVQFCRYKIVEPQNSAFQFRVIPLNDAAVDASFEFISAFRWYNLISKDEDPKIITKTNRLLFL